MSTSTDVAARRAEIERRYNRHESEQRKSRRRRYSPCALRLRDLYLIRDHRWGPAPLPEGGDGVTGYIYLTCNTLAGLVGDPTKRIRDFLTSHVPWWDDDQIDDLIDTITASPTRYSADSAAFAIGLDRATRDLLKIRTIGAVDLLKPQREALRLLKGRDRERQRRARLQKEKPQRETLESTKPWEAIGISRATYYRRRERFDAQLLPAKEIWKWK